LATIKEFMMSIGQKRIIFFIVIVLMGSLFAIPLKNDLAENQCEDDSFLNQYDLPEDAYIEHSGRVKRGQSFGQLLSEYGLNLRLIDLLVNSVNDSFNFRNFKEGQPYKVYSSCVDGSPKYFVYESSIFQSILFDLTPDKFSVKKIEKEKEIRVELIEGEIESSLWNAMIEKGASFELASKLEDAFQWSIDFYHLQKGDQFKVVFENIMVDGQNAGIGDLYSAYFCHNQKDNFAVYFDRSYYDLEGRPMKKTFLKSPIKYARISSRYNTQRLHPVLKRVRPHLGTDYAAPYGTPIYAVADGVVIEARYSGGNGNYVKIRHNGTYQTQYLHMQKFASGISSGRNVSQGDVIGYVGSTGLSTGPHVCFRFWKNGQQINHLNLTFPAPEPLTGAKLDSFLIVRDQVTPLLNLNSNLGFQEFQQ
jgi:murein DD-endopeptidase MepM/ murein hydrolase activator NlpD